MFCSKSSTSGATSKHTFEGAVMNLQKGHYLPAFRAFLKCSYAVRTAMIRATLDLIRNEIACYSTARKGNRKGTIMAFSQALTLRVRFYI